MKTSFNSLFILLILIFTGCSEYNKVLKSRDPEKKFAAAVEYYNKKEYYKALPIFEELIGLTRGTTRAEDVYYYYAKSNFGVKDYYLANYYFNSFTKTYPQSQYAEECLFMAAICSSNLSPPYTLDQQDTRTAINELQLFLDRYPSSSRRDTCNLLIEQLHGKLERKEYDVAMQYVRTEKYKGAVVALNQFLKDYPATKHREEILYLLVKCNYLLAEGSLPEKQRERYKATMDNYFIFAAAFPESKYLPDAEDYYNKSRKKIEKQSQTDTAKKE